jgi:uncharacterized coiled-coil DUF342 family protein
VKLGSAGQVIPKVQNLVDSYFKQPNAAVKGGAYTVLNGHPAQKTAADVTFWNSQQNKKIDTSKTQTAVQKIGHHVQELEKLKHAAAQSGQKKVVAKVVRKEKKQLRKIAKKVNRLVTKLNKKEKALTKLAANPKVVDPNVKSAITNSLNQVRQYKAAVKNVKKQVKQDKKALKN